MSELLFFDNGSPTIKSQILPFGLYITEVLIQHLKQLGLQFSHIDEFILIAETIF